MKRGFCICGNEICDGSKELKNLQDLIAFIPPQSLGTLINTFSNECKSRTRSGENIYETVKNILAEVEERKTTNEDLQAEISDLEGKIKSFENIGQCQIQLNSYREDKRKNSLELDGINMQIGSLTRERDRQETERNKLHCKVMTIKRLRFTKLMLKRFLKFFLNIIANVKKKFVYNLKMPLMIFLKRFIKVDYRSRLITNIISIQ